MAAAMYRLRYLGSNHVYKRSVKLSAKIAAREASDYARGRLGGIPRKVAVVDSGDRMVMSCEPGGTSKRIANCWIDPAFKAKLKKRSR